MTSIQMQPRAYGPQHRPYRAYGAAAAMWSCRDLEVVMEGPAGTGKSRAVLEKLNFCAMKYPRMRGLLVRKTRESMTESGLVTFEEKVLPENSPIAAGSKRGQRQSYDYPNGSTIVVAGLVSGGRDQKAKVMSTEYDLIVVLEATELIEHEYEQLLTRLRNGQMPYQQLIADCNPDVPTHWLHRRCDDGRATVFFSRHEDNPGLYDHQRRDWTPAGRTYVLGALEALTGARYLRLRKGQRAAQEGAIYEFDRSKHLIDAMPKGWEAWRKVRVIDFGYTNPFVCQWWAIDPDGRMYLYREIYYSHRATEDHQRQILYLSMGERIEANIADHDAEDRATLKIARAFYCEDCKVAIASAAEEDQHKQHKLLKGSIETAAAYKAVKRGIVDGVQPRLKEAGDKRPRLFVVRDCRVELDQRLVKAALPTCTAEEFDGYIWASVPAGKTAPEEPVKKNDHGMDALRYGVAYVDDLAAVTGVEVAESPWD